eukprot:1838766-Rhodomonas_salina.1
MTVCHGVASQAVGSAAAAHSMPPAVTQAPPATVLLHNLNHCIAAVLTGRLQVDTGVTVTVQQTRKKSH